MHTVLFFCQSSMELLKLEKQLFEPFIKNETISLCNWYDSGTDLGTAVPDLYKLLRGKERWRAIILHNAAEDCEHSIISAAKERNPFDFNTEGQDRIRFKESEVPIIRLTHMLAGFPPMGVKDFEEVYSYTDILSGNEEILRREDLNEEKISGLKEKYGQGFHINYLEIPHENDDIESHKALSRKYEFLETQPAEIILIATRKKSKESEKKSVKRSWEDNLESASSNFWERNNYPTICKFLVYDIVNEQNSTYQKDILKFWLGVLAISMNKIPPSALQSYRLYRFDVEIDKVVFSEILNTHISQLLHNIKNMEGFINQPKENAPDSKAVLIREEPVPIELETYNEEVFSVCVEDFPIMKSNKGSEINALTERMRQIDANIRKVIKKNKRILDIASKSIREKSQHFLGEEYQLDEYQVEDLKEELQSIENDIYNPETKFIFDEGSIRRKIVKNEAILHNYLLSRYERNILLKIGGIVLFANAIGFIPYIENSVRLGLRNAIYSLLLTSGSLMTASAGGVFALLLLKRSLDRKIEELNSSLKEEMIHIVNNEQTFGTYLAKILSYLKGQAILSGVKQKEKTELTYINKLKQHKKSHEALVDHEISLLESFGTQVAGTTIGNQPAPFDPNISPRENSFYCIEPNSELETMKFNNTGEKLTSPYKFVSKLVIDREDLFGKEELESS